MEQNINPREISTTACDPSGKQVARRTIDVNDIHIPDLWHIAQRLRDEGHEEAADNVLNVWHLAHDARIKLRSLAGYEGEGNPAGFDPDEDYIEGRM